MPKTIPFAVKTAGLPNPGAVLPDLRVSGLLVLPLCTGFFLAGIYPVGMKIASDYYQAGLGKSPAFLVGALVIVTAIPHLLKNIVRCSIRYRSSKLNPLLWFCCIDFLVAVSS